MLGTLSMKKINDKSLSIPPYISTAWTNINTLHVKMVDGKSILFVLLQNGTTIEVPNLEAPAFKDIFEAHEKFLNSETDHPTNPKNKPKINKDSDLSLSFGFPFKLNGISGIENIGSFLHHNGDLKDSPKLPPEIVAKISAITKSLGMNPDELNIPKAEPHCNCPYCQVARALSHPSKQKEKEDGEEEIVTEKDLSFREWDIKQTGDKLYEVTNPLDHNEHYQVYLGTPIGCTCGEKNCEHIRAVLSS